MINTDRHFKVLLANYICFNFSKFPPKNYKQKNRSVIHENSRAKNVILGHRVRKVRDNWVRKKKGLIKRKAQGHIEHEACETQEQVGHEARMARELGGHVI